MSKGLIHIYCGDGKGKTTSAVGLAIRTAGNGKKILFVQFLKSGQSGEIELFKSIDNIDVLRGKDNTKFVCYMTGEEKAQIKSKHDICLDEAIRKAMNYDMLVLDELCATYRMGLIDKEKVLEFLQHKPKSLEIVITGRDPEEELLELADYVSEIKKVRHPFDKGVKARKGIEL